MTTLVAFCKAVADALRIDILRVLRSDSFGVLELSHIFDMPQSGISHHLKLLSTAGLLVPRREGNHIFYRRALIGAADPLQGLRRSLLQAADQTPLQADITARMQSVQADRAERSRLFFEKNADALETKQALIAAFHQYEACVMEALRNEAMPQMAAAMEVGPGGGELLRRLSGRFDRVYALDNSPEMLARAKEAVNCGNVTFLMGDINIPDSNRPAMDLIVMNMVLHHLASPAGVFVRVEEALAAGGRLLLVDLGAHHQDWARDTCGDLWLGFDPDDLDQWAADAGLAAGQSLIVGLKNGFQIQLRWYHK